MIRSASQLKGPLLGVALVIGFVSSAMTQSAQVGDPTVIKGTIAQYSLTSRGAMDGLILADGTGEVAKSAEACRPGMPVVYTTDKATVASLKAQFPKDSYFLPKPYTEGDLLVSVKASLRS